MDNNAMKMYATLSVPLERVKEEGIYSGCSFCQWRLRVIYILKYVIKLNLHIEFLLLDICHSLKKNVSSNGNSNMNNM